MGNHITVVSNKKVDNTEVKAYIYQYDDGKVAVNWPSYGEMSIEFAQEFIDNLQKTVNQAKSLTK